MLSRSTAAFFRRQTFRSNVRCLCKESPPADLSPLDEKKVDERKNKKPKISSEEAKNKLNSLLASFTKQASEPKPELKIAKPHGVKKLVKKEILDKKGKEDKKIVEAAREVARSLGGETEKTEQELIERVQSHQAFFPSQRKADDESESGPVEEKVVDKDTLESTKRALSETLMGMQVDRKPSQEKSLYNDTRYNENRRNERNDEFESDSVPRSRLHEFKRMNFRGRSAREEKPINFEEIEPTELFADYRSERDADSVLSTWNDLSLREMKLSVTHPPRNCFEEMIRWTEKGMLWTLPLDNEIEMEENHVSFSDHIFLERHLEPWCPRKGPVRHFMELVCVGLSKNPYITVERKMAHIEWYKNYFEEKEDILREVGALEQ